MNTDESTVLCCICKFAVVGGDTACQYQWLRNSLSSVLDSYMGEKSSPFATIIKNALTHV